MLRYSFELAVRGLRRFPKSTVLVVLTAALGLAACMTTLTLLHVLSADPLPGRSQNLYLAWVDTVLAKPSNAGDDIMALNGIKAHNYHNIKLADAQALLAAHRATRQAVVVDMVADEVSDDGRHAQNQQEILTTTSDFIPMFGVALRYGRDWTPAEDAARAPVAVIDTDLAQKLFGTSDAVGRSVRLKHTLFRVVGVIQPYAPQPRFYVLNQGEAYSSDGGENLYVPYTAALDAGLSPNTTDDCDASYKGSIMTAIDPAHCASLGLWVQLDTPRQVAAYRTYLQNYVEQQKALGDFGKAPRSQLTGVADWLQQNDVVPDSVRLNVWLAGSFLLLCMVNVAGLLSARFLRRSGDVGIRRALGAPRRAVFLQHVLESGLACLVGGVLALPLTLLGLWILRQQSSDFSGLARLDPAMFGSLFVLTLAVGVLVGLLPAWRVSRVEPGLQVKGE